MTAVNSDAKTRFFLKTGRRQQLTRQLITAHVQVIAASPTHIRRALLRNVYTVLRLQPWRQANVYTVTRSPGADWMDAVTRPSHRRCAVVVGGLVRRVSEHGLLML